MKLTSSSFLHHGNIPPKYTCDGDDCSPPLQISDIPPNAESLVLIMDDPDAMKPAGKVWDHWVIWNIPVDTTEISEGEEPHGIHGLGTSNNMIYHGPCPPNGEHAYIFRLYALDRMLDLPEKSTKSEVLSAIRGHILEQAELIGKYTR
ncbi:MAG: YbhB/YbcL family Raf kinase inhibitor-like protein [Candidatus Magasanikbacteria bacterium CG_4_10_14_0_2_um_filter_37_12]|uniref:YbhB/YbcL family Raf kinase inhibitor-like protein n=1 Tax=Candidatus Magasanikbacteria bacterium CG_4_10_14_0_2_um_filter_37_12 TaxID=1974637 RepID=A0A2M7V8L8_9BACT|nr:MAG: YbhB/YbcL family Raf kinase inhibitor-like protein [Candidatus Magasanikbacteria bacterium CG_4_10_14_0_2_um_filter_37_12]